MIALCDPRFAPANVKLTSRRFLGLLIHTWEFRKIIRLKTICKSFALGKRSEVTVYGNDFATPDGTGVQDYIHVSDLARAHVLALNEMFASPGVSHVLNCGYGRGHSVLDVLNTVGQGIGRPIPHVFGPRRPGDSRKRYVAPVPDGLTRLPRRLSSKPSELGALL
jgi:UDP-glucose 4-epimerase